MNEPEHREEHRHGGDRRRHPTRRDIDKRLLRVMIALAFVFLVVASVASVVALVNARDVAANADAIEANRIEQQYARDIAKWHFDLSGCRQGTGIFRTLLARGRADARLFAREAVVPAVRIYFSKRVKAIDRQLAFYKPELCDVRFPKPATPSGVEELG